MTKSSKSRLNRRGEAKVAKPKVFVPESLIKFTELEGGGFTFSLGLHGARMEAITPGVATKVSIVDVMALAVAQLLRSESEDLKEAVRHVNEILRNVNQGIEEGKSVEEVMREVALIDEKEPA